MKWPHVVSCNLRVLGPIDRFLLFLQEMVEAAGEDERELAAEMAAAFLNENLPEAIFGAPKAGAGQWASLVRLVNPIQGSTLDQVQLEQNEAAFRYGGVFRRDHI